MEKSFDITSLATNKEAEVNGVWADCPGGLRLLVARNNCPAYQKFVIKRRKKIQQEVRFQQSSVEDLDPETILAITREGMSKHLLLGWENMNENGAEIPHSQEESLRLLTKYPEFFDIVDGLASDVQRYKDKADAETAGN